MECEPHSKPPRIDGREDRRGRGGRLGSWSLAPDDVLKASCRFACRDAAKGPLLIGLALSAQDIGSVTRELGRLEQAGSEATVKKDRAALERLYADDYSYIHSNGSVATKAQELADIVSPDSKWTSTTMSCAKN